LVSRQAYAEKVDLRLRHAACEILKFPGNVWAGDLARKLIHLFRYIWVVINRYAQAMA